jgi:phosphopantothenoylcysteine decarboxylase/phosphopantothenate--cysteine ligase
MDLDMYRHPTTSRNIEIIQSFGHTLIEPTVGELASGLCGAGRMEEPEHILQVITDFFRKSGGPFKGKRILVTAGPTFEQIDPVRYIGNHSSGLMGFSLAEEFARNGGDVTLITGPVAMTTDHSDIRRIDVVSAAEMLQACEKHGPASDIIVMSAAVADFTPSKPLGSKLKKSGAGFSLELKPTVDILGTLGAKKKKHQLLIGFALETEREEENAKKKLEAKNLDMIVMNSLNDPGAGFKTTTNKVTVFTRSAKPVNIPLKPKQEIAADLLKLIAALL